MHIIASGLSSFFMVRYIHSKRVVIVFLVLSSIILFIVGFPEKKKKDSEGECLIVINQDVFILDVFRSGKLSLIDRPTIISVSYFWKGIYLQFLNKITIRVGKYQKNQVIVVVHQKSCPPPLFDKFSTMGLTQVNSILFMVQVSHSTLQHQWNLH